MRRAVLRWLSAPARQIAGVPVWIRFAFAARRELERLEE